MPGELPGDLQDDLEVIGRCLQLTLPRFTIAALAELAVLAALTADAVACHGRVRRCVTLIGSLLHVHAIECHTMRLQHRVASLGPRSHSCELEQDAVCKASLELLEKELEKLCKSSSLRFWDSKGLYRVYVSVIVLG